MLASSKLHARYSDKNGDPLLPFRLDKESDLLKWVSPSNPGAAELMVAKC